MTMIEAHQYQAPENLLADRVILVTGANKGIGKCAAITFAEHGATVVLAGRNRRQLEAVHDEILEAGSPQPGIAVLDLARSLAEDYFALAEALGSEYGRLDGLLHNASILGHRTPIAQYDVAVWHEVLHVNLTAAFVLTQVLYDLLDTSQDASILFTSSGVGRVGKAFWGAYSVSKFGTEGLSQILAEETSASGRMRVNCINPGATRTGMRSSAYPAEDPLTLPTPEEIMPAYLYLLGPDSKGVTGQSIDAQSA